MKHQTLTALVAVAWGVSSLGLLSGCVIHETAVAEPDGTVVYQEVEPAPIVEVVPERPAVGYIWVGGGWVHYGHRWVWHRGHWHH